MSGAKCGEHESLLLLGGEHDVHLLVGLGRSRSCVSLTQELALC